MRRFAVALAMGSLLSLGIQTASYGQVQRFFEQYQDQQPGYQGQRSGNSVGSTVYGRDGNNLGVLSQVITDPQTGQPLYGIIRSGGIFGFGAIERPVPWQMFSTNQNGLYLDMTESRLRDAPSYTAGDQPDLNHPRWQRRIADFYGVQPFSGGPGYGGSQGYSGQQGGYLYQNLFNRDSIQRFSGTVERVWHRTQGDQMQVSLRTDDGRRVMVVLAPEWYLENYNAEPRQGDHITVRGSLVSSQGRQFLIATMLRTENQRLQLRNNDGVPTWLQDQQRQQGDYGNQQQYGY